MADINNVTFSGRLTKDAILKTLPTGSKLVAFDIANNTGWGDYAKTMYITVNLWGKVGESVLPHLKKATHVGIAGELEQQKWTSNQDGQEKTKLVVNARNVILLQPPKASNQTTAWIDEEDTEEVQF
jgi:single stranded DNA-binding protein